ASGAFAFFLAEFRVRPGRSEARPVPRQSRRLPGLPYRGEAGRHAVRRRARAEDAVRYLLRTEHHLAPAAGHRALERAGLHARAAPGRATRRRALLPRLPLSVVHPHRRRGPARSLRVPAQPAAERAAQPRARARLSLSLAFPPL